MKFISMLLAFIMSLFGLTPAIQPIDAYTQAQWYALVADEFNLTYDLSDDDNYGISQDDDYFEVVEACHDWGVIVGKYDAEALITDVLIAKSLAVAIGLEDAKESDETALNLAIDAGIISVSVNLFGNIKETVVSKDVANAALKTAGNVYLQNLKNVQNGGTVAVEEQGVIEMSDLALIENANGLTLQSSDGKIINEKEITALNYEGSVNPFVHPETAGIGQQSILDDINISFSIGDLDVSAGIKDGGFDVSVSGSVNGVNVTKAYEVRNFNVATKFEGNLSVNEVKRSYIIVDYDLKDTTTLTSSAAWSLDETPLPEGSDDVDFFARVQNNLFEMKDGADSEIEVFSVDVAIPNCPAITIGITAKLVITFDGRVDLIITSSETKGIEIIDGKARTISESVAGDSELIAQARVETILGLYVDISIVNIVLVDAGIEVGLGIHVTVHMTGGAATYKLDIPYDFLLDINFTFPNSENVTATVNVKIYGIVKISVGENSPILDKLGLNKTWVLVHEDNGTFVDETFDLVRQAA